MSNLDELTRQLRALRLPDEAMVILEVGSVREPQCGDDGAISVRASKSGITLTVEALRLEDALLMVRAHINAAIVVRDEAAAKTRKEGKA